MKRPSSRYCSIAELKAGLSSFVREAAAGHEILVTDHNRPAAKLVPVSRIPPLPKADLKDFFRRTPMKTKKGTPDSATLIRQIRDEEGH